MLYNFADEDGDGQEMMDRFVRVLNMAAAIEREPVDIGHGVLLYPSEVHLIDIAGRYPDEGISRIAMRLGITKGAVSQTAKRLEEKGYLERANQEGDKKTVLLRLTIRGEVAFNWHRRYHAMVNRNLEEEIRSLSARDLENLRRFFVRVEEIFAACPSARAAIALHPKEG